MLRRQFMKFGVAAGFLTSCAGSKNLIKSENNQINKIKPNILLIFADDLGYADVGYHGCKEIPTPNIDAIAKNGISFTDAYVTAPVCGPSRVALMTGKYQQFIGCGSNIGPYLRTPDVKLGLPLEEKTMADRFKEAGYKTACFGKWHLGGEDFDLNQQDKSLFPLNRGFDDFFGFLEGAALYNDLTNREKKYMRGNERIEREEEYYTDAIGREALDFLDRNHDKPFFLYIPFNAVHAPLQAPEKYRKKFPHIINKRRKKMAAMLYAMDLNIGKIMKKICKYKLEENTLVFFISDNGGKPNDNYSYNTPLRGEKTTLWEGGIRVPFCMQWKGHLPGNKVYNHPVSTLDVLPTSLSAAGIDIKEEWNLDGVNLFPYLSGKDTDQPHEWLFWKYIRQSAVRYKNWKLLKLSDDQQPVLYNLKDDLGEKKPVNNKQIFDLMMNKYKEWDKKTIPDNFGWNRTYKYTIPGYTE